MRWIVPLAFWLGLLTGTFPLMAAADAPEPAPLPSSSSALQCGYEMGHVCRVEPDAQLERSGIQPKQLIADQPNSAEQNCPDGKQSSRMLSLAPVQLCDTFRTGEKGSRLEVRLREDGLLVLGSNTLMILQPAGTLGGRPCSSAARAQLFLRQGAVRLQHRSDLGSQVVDVVTPAALICLEGTDIIVAHHPGTHKTVVRVQDGEVKVLLNNGKVIPVNAEKKLIVSEAPLPELLRNPAGLFFDSPLLDPFDLGAVGTTP